MSIRRSIVLSLMALCLSGCAITPPPTTQPSNLTPAQQAQINFANSLQQDADFANTAFQAAAIFDPALAKDAALAKQVDAEVDTLVGQYVADVTAGTVPPDTLLAQINTDLAQILGIVGKSQTASQKFTQLKAAKVAKH